MGEKYSCCHQNGRKISSGQLCCGGPGDPIIVDFLQRVIRDIEKLFAGVGKVLREIFFPRILFVKSKNLPPIVGDLSTSLVNKYGIVPQNHVKSPADKYKSLLQSTC